MNTTPQPPGRYTPKPLTVRAIQYTGDNQAEVESFHGTPLITTSTRTCCQALLIPTREGDMAAPCGWGIVRDANDGLNAIAPAVFADTYTLTEAQPA